jgi:beta-mannosidase
MSDPSIESVTEATQVGAGEFYQVFSEKTQANYPVTTGLMPWVFKRHWPVIAIQMLDWFGNAGAPYYFLKRTYETTHIALDIERMLWAPGEQMKLNVKITNASVAKLKPGHTVSVATYDDNFKKLYSEESALQIADAPTVSSHSFNSYKIPADYRDRYLFVVVELKDAQKKLVSRSFYYPRVVNMMEDKTFYNKYISEPIAWVTFDKGPWLKPTVAKATTTLSARLQSVKQISGMETAFVLQVTNTGSKPAFMAKVDIAGADRAVVASDNYFWLQPGEAKVITMNVLWRGKQSNAAIRVNAWNAKPVNVSLK